MTNQSPAVEALRLAEELKALRRRRSGIVCGLLTAAACDKLDAEQDALIDRLSTLAQPAPAVAVEAERGLVSALNCMLTYFGMDEDESNKGVFDQARCALDNVSKVTR